MLDFGYWGVYLRMDVEGGMEDGDRSWETGVGKMMVF